MKSYPAFRAWCDVCGSEYRVPSSIQDSAEFVMRSASLLHHVVVDVTNDDVLKRIFEFVRTSPKFSSLMLSDKVTVARNIFGSICDPAPDATHYSFHFPESCPHCGSKGFHFGPVASPKPLLLDLLHVKHVHWDSMDEASRTAVLMKVPPGPPYDPITGRPRS
jgi:hypothetical protein